MAVTSGQVRKFLLEIFGSRASGRIDKAWRELSAAGYLPMSGRGRSAAKYDKNHVINWFLACLISDYRPNRNSVLIVKVFSELDGFYDALDTTFISKVECCFNERWAVVYYQNGEQRKFESNEPPISNIKIRTWQTFISVAVQKIQELIKS